MRADDRVEAVLFDEFAQLARMADIGEVNGRGNAGGAVHFARVIHQAEHLRRFGGDGVEELVKAQRAGVPEHVQHIQKLRLVPARFERFFCGEGAVIVAFAGAAA